MAVIPWCFIFWGETPLEVSDGIWISAVCSISKIHTWIIGIIILWTVPSYAGLTIHSCTLVTSISIGVRNSVASCPKIIWRSSIAPRSILLTIWISAEVVIKIRIWISCWIDWMCVNWFVIPSCALPISNTFLSQNSGTTIVVFILVFNPTWSSFIVIVNSL